VRVWCSVLGLGWVWDVFVWGGCGMCLFGVDDCGWEGEWVGCVGGWVGEWVRGVGGVGGGGRRKALFKN
jgi:hypothetical protein